MRTTEHTERAIQALRRFGQSLPDVPCTSNGDTMNPITKAEGEINIILAKLEQETDSIVERIDLADIEVTRMDSDRRQVQRSVRIDMARLPGTNWST